MRLQVIGRTLVAMRRSTGSASLAGAPDAWYKLIGLRNIISHGYKTINHERIWSMIADGLTELGASLAVFDES